MRRRSVTLLAVTALLLFVLVVVWPEADDDDGGAHADDTSLSNAAPRQPRRRHTTTTTTTLLSREELGLPPAPLFRFNVTWATVAALRPDAYALATTDAPCVLWIHLGNLTVAPADGVVVAQCTLWEVLDPQALLPRAPYTHAHTGPLFALLRTASSLDFVVEKYLFGLFSAHAYARIHNYRLFLYVLERQPDVRFYLNLLPKQLGVRAVLAELGDAATEEGVFMSDLDGWMDLTETEAFAVQSVVARVRASRSGGSGSKDFGVLVQGEINMCSCISVQLRRSAYGRDFWENIGRRCHTEFRSDMSLLCEHHQFDQFGFLRELLGHMNNSHGLVAPSDVCAAGLNPADNTAMCFNQDPYWKPETGWASRAWPDLAFVAQDGTRDRPQLHSCMKQWRGCDDNVALWYHTGAHAGTWYWSDKRKAAERALLDHFRAKGVPLADDARFPKL